MAEDPEAEQESESELERLVKSRRTGQADEDPGVRLIRQLRRTDGTAASSAGTARERSRSNPGAGAQAFMSVDVATDDERGADGDTEEDIAWKEFHRYQCVAKRTPETEQVRKL